MSFINLGDALTCEGCVIFQFLFPFGNLRWEMLYDDKLHSTIVDNIRGEISRCSAVDLNFLDRRKYFFARKKLLKLFLGNNRKLSLWLVPVEQSEMKGRRAATSDARAYVINWNVWCLMRIPACLESLGEEKLQLFDNSSCGGSCDSTSDSFVTRKGFAFKFSLATVNSRALIHKFLIRIAVIKNGKA